MVEGSLTFWAQASGLSNTGPPKAPAGLVAVWLGTEDLHGRHGDHADLAAASRQKFEPLAANRTSETSQSSGQRIGAVGVSVDSRNLKHRGRMM